ncbi:MAG TPA: lanthionine synthetase C family protein [Pseudonocardiaceae bacterium]|nr:lanthionine synthetase C family protein [Pseudonocardiaceae bacterium]
MTVEMALERALEIADRFADPDADELPTDQAWWHQSLAHGAPGIAVLHSELAAAGQRPFRRVHDWLTVAASSTVTTGETTGLFYGAPAIAYALAHAAVVRPSAYQRALADLDVRVAADAHRRAEAAHDRIAAGHLPHMAEFDTIRGLAGVGAYLLYRDPHGPALRSILGYLVRLTQPLADPSDTGQLLPGWWTLTGPTGRIDPDFPGGHGNFGLAHGVAGPLAVLAHCARQGVRVAGQRDAIATICSWLDAWRIDTDTGYRWPYMITRRELTTRPAHVHHSGAARRPSWCYGTAGIARCLQLAALALGDDTRRSTAEAALVCALTDPAHRALTADASLCHGYAGLARIAAHAAADAAEPAASQLRALVPDLLSHALTQPTTATPGLLEGAAGIALAVLTAITEPSGEAPVPHGWDAFLLI